MIHREIRKLRDSTGLTQAVFAAALGTTANTVARWERGEMHPSWAMCEKMNALAWKQKNPGGQPWPESKPRKPKFSLEMLQKKVARVLKKKKIRGLVIIGGATAMAAGGYARHTQDVDIFLRPRGYSNFDETHEESALGRVLAAFEEDGFLTRELKKFHWIARMPGDPDGTRRVDILTPEGECVDQDTITRWAGTFDQRDESPLRGLPVFSLPAVARQKLLAWDDDPLDRGQRHGRDVAEMLRTGALTKPQLATELQGDPGEHAALRRFVASWPTRFVPIEEEGDFLDPKKRKPRRR